MAAKRRRKSRQPPVPGYNVVTTLDLHLQELAEKALASESEARRDCDHRSELRATFSRWLHGQRMIRTYLFRRFRPRNFKELQDDPNIPLLPRAYRSAYPPGSTFKVAVGIAALESGAVTPDDSYQCVPAIDIGNVTFHNWKKTDRGDLNFVQALTESCDTWFYQVGIKTGAEPIIDWAQRLGFGAKCGIPLRGEAEGRVPNDKYMKATHGRRLLNGDIANMSIGQGDLLVTPLQMAQAMAIVANGGTFYQTRLVQQVQTVDNQIVTAYNVREKKTLGTSAANHVAVAHRHGGGGQWRRRHGAPGKPGNRVGSRKNRNGAMGSEKQGTHGGVVCRIRAGRSSALCLRRTLRKRSRQHCSWRIGRRADDRRNFAGCL